MCLLLSRNKTRSHCNLCISHQMHNETRRFSTQSTFKPLFSTSHKSQMFGTTVCKMMSIFTMGVSAHFKGRPVYETSTLRPLRPKNSELEAESNLFRCMSDASLVKRRRGRGKSMEQREKERQHRFSINGHFYNYKARFSSTSLCVLLNLSLLFSSLPYSLNLTKDLLFSPDLYLHTILWYFN